jgi:diguanylate cyclase (GGDEF)-like protein
MAAHDHQNSRKAPHDGAGTHEGAGPHDRAGPRDGAGPCLSASALSRRLREEVNRAGRHGTALSCLLVSIEELASLQQSYSRELSEKALAYVGLALRSEFRDFDRVGRPSDSEFLVILPGADGPRAEIVARRTLGRLRSIKLEVDGERRPLRVSVGLVAWREGSSAEELVGRAREAAGREGLGFPDALRL